MNTYKIEHNEVPDFYWSNDLRQYVDNGLDCCHEIYVDRDMAVGMAEELDGHVVYAGDSGRWVRGF